MSKSKLDTIRAKAIDLVAEAIDDEDIPAAKRADMALSLLGKQAIKEQPEEQPKPTGPIEIIFRVVDDDAAELMPALDYSAEHTEVIK